MKNTKESTINAANAREAKILKRLGNFFFNARNDRKVSVRALNHLSGVSVAVISDLENAKSMPRIWSTIFTRLKASTLTMWELFF